MSGMDTTPPVDESFAQLHRAMWSVADVRVLTPAGVVWQVEARNGEHFIRARAPSQAETFHLACKQARALGLLDTAVP
jgi:hypothetical protein